VQKSETLTAPKWIKRACLVPAAFIVLAESLARGGHAFKLHAGHSLTNGIKRLRRQWRSF
jgi:hypothetical protein